MPLKPQRPLVQQAYSVVSPSSFNQHSFPSSVHASSPGSPDGRTCRAGSLGVGGEGQTYGGGKSPYGDWAHINYGLGTADGANSSNSHLSDFSNHSNVSLLPKKDGAWSGAKKGRKVGGVAGWATAATYIYDPKNSDTELDDHLHSPSRDAFLDGRSCIIFSARGWLNMGALVFLSAGLVALFAGYPIISYYSTHPWSHHSGWNIGGVNGTGQVPVIPNLNGLIDSDTPDEAKVRTGFDGNNYNLVFSDEFNMDGRTFWPGDDPYWEAVDLHYWATGDYEWYDPDATVTKDGYLVITVTEQPLHDLQFRSGMLQSWNKFCFTGGYIEVSVSLPGSHDVPGFWPGAWTLGNLARAGYGATTDGLWPYSYNSCDVGTFPNQTNLDGTTPAAALTSGTGPNGELSYLPGQRLSACTCKGSDHPGPSTSVGRGAPEIDVLEALVSNKKGTFYGGVSQSAQFAPFDDGYNWNNGTSATTIYNSTATNINSYRGGVFQEATSAITVTDPGAYNQNGGGFQKFGFEYTPGADGEITWSVGDTASWKVTGATVGPNAASGVGQRLISEEPMSIVLNLAISASFQNIDWADLQLPNHMLIDYVRVYQREGQENVGCDPPNFPTANYINNHINAYTNPNFTTWAQAGYKFPTNSLYTSC